MPKEFKEPFAFDLSLAAEQNIELFLDSLKDLDEQMAGLLRANIGKLLPLLEGQARIAARIVVHSEVAKSLDKLAE